MARDTVKPVSHTGLYAQLLDREERAAPGKGFTVEHGDGTNYQGSPQRLKALRAGQPVSMPVGDLPRHARGGLDTRWMHRARVSPDGSVELYVDSGREWLAEQGL